MVSSGNSSRRVATTSVGCTTSAEAGMAGTSFSRLRRSLTVSFSAAASRQPF